MIEGRSIGGSISEELGGCTWFRVRRLADRMRDQTVVKKRKSHKQWSGVKTRKNLLSPETGWKDTVAEIATTGMQKERWGRLEPMVKGKSPTGWRRWIEAGGRVFFELVFLSCFRKPTRRITVEKS